MSFREKPLSHSALRQAQELVPARNSSPISRPQATGRKGIDSPPRRLNLTSQTGFPNWESDLCERLRFWRPLFFSLSVSGCGQLPADASLPPAEANPETTSPILATSSPAEDTFLEEAAPGESANRELAVPVSGDTALTTAALPATCQTIYLWEKDNVPAVTKYVENDRNYFDEPDFRPYLVSFPVPEGTPINGAVLICAGGAFIMRSDENEGAPVAEELARRGYQSFVVNYRLRPYTQEEGALDLARAVRFVRANADIYGIDPDDIAVLGFSAGGILAGEMLLHFDGAATGADLDPEYVPDALDQISADAAAAGMIYAFYGVLSRGITDAETLRAGDLPPTFYCYGTQDPFFEQFRANADAAEAAGVTVERLELPDRPHGFGWRENWIDDFDTFLAGVFD